MESEDMDSLPTTVTGGSSENNELVKSELEPGELVAQQSNLEESEVTKLVNSCGFNETGQVAAVEVLAESKTAPDTLVDDQGDVRNELGQCPEETEVEMDLVDSPIRQVNIQVADNVVVSENLSRFGFSVNAPNGSLDCQNDVTAHNHKQCGPVTGVKRSRMTYDQQQPSVDVTFNFLTRSSKRKLEELLLKWSEWHAHHVSSSQDPNELLECGKETYFPALSAGMEKSSSVSFLIENQTKNEQSSDLTPEGVSVPLYDRGFAFGLTSADAPSNAEGGLEIVGEAARCFNCGSYSHSLRECPKPRDNAAVNQARKQHKSKRNQNPNSRNATRYYQNSSGGKYDGLKPGSLDAETRRLLGLGELDPPPWLNRMRELGYPPGYLDTEDEDKPSGITIFADEEIKVEQEDGEIFEIEHTEPKKKMAVEFPGINAPIPENADERAWAPEPSRPDPNRRRTHNRPDHSFEPSNRRYPHEQRASWDSIDNGPPGVNSVFSPPSSYPPRYGNYDSGPYGRSYSERGRRSPLVYDDVATHNSSSKWWENESEDQWRARDDGPSGLGEHERAYRGSDEYSRHHRPYSWR